MMKEYSKIETLFNRDKSTFKVIENDWRTPEFEYLKDLEWSFTEKIDGTNIRIEWIPKVSSRFGGRTDRAQMPPFLMARLEEIFTDTVLQSVFPDTDVVLYGEGFGARIQKGGGNYIPDGVDFILFDVLVGGYWLKRDALEDIADKLGIGVVPIIGIGNLQEAVDIVKNGFTSTFGNFIGEGLVVKPKEEMFSRNGHRIIGKIKGKDFS